MRFRSLLALTVAGALLPATASAAVHTVAPGETLSGIAAVNGLSPAAVAAANGLSPTAFVIAGTNLTIPAAGVAAPAAPVAAAPTATGSGYQVAPGDSLSTIAARMGVSRSALAAANGLAADGWVIAGTHLKAPGATAGAPAAPSSGAPEPMGGYTVRPGDTLGALAARSGVPVAQMAAMNGLDPARILLAGTPLKLPTGSPVAAAPRRPRPRRRSSRPRRPTPYPAP